MADEATAANQEAAQQRPVSLTPAAHKGVRVKQAASAGHIEKNHFAKIYTTEFSKAGVDYPIIFIKEPDTDNFMAVAMWGLEPGENLFVEDGEWKGGYYPASIRCFPFAVQPDPENKERLFIGIYENAHVLNTDDGNLIFNEDDTETDWMKEVKEFLVKVYQQEEMTKEFCKKLNELGLLVPQALSLSHKDSGETKDVGGFYTVDRKKLQELTDEQALDLRKSGALELVFNHLMSLDSLDKLLRKKNIIPKVQDSKTEPDQQAVTQESQGPSDQV